MSKLKNYLPTVLKGSAVLGTVAAAAYFYRKDDTQKQHSILRNFPLIGRIRYMTEQIGPELRQYLFENNNEGTPFSRKEFEDVVKAGKYKERLIGFGSERDFNEAGYYIRNSMFPNLREELRIDNSQKINTKVYEVDEEGLLTRKEKREDRQIEPYFLRDEDAVIIGGDTCRNPFKLKGLVGQSAMSYGALGENAITALSRGLGLAGGTWMNTGEGGLSKYHLSGNPDIMMQIGPGLFGVRTPGGEFSWEEFKKKSEIEQVKAFEIKLAQGAKIRGGHIEGQKVTEEIAQIRLVEPGQTINSPNRFYEFKNFNELFEFVERMRDVGGKPIGIKIVVGDLDALEEMTKTMRDTGKGPDFITVDGGEGGTGATYQELADAVGLPIMSALPLVDEMLKKYGVRNRVKLIASGKLTSPDKVAVALAMGADLVNIARGFMISVGCIMAEICHTNHCPAGVATTDSKLQEGLVIEEKQYRVANYVISLREGLFNLAAAAGIDTPTKFERKHIVHKDEWGRVSPVRDITLTPEKVEKLRNKEKVEK
ncbi:FMN-binding glutamate synthase family protein [Peribacillus frigoritolerans]|jgi:glutamate synthase domain-containing protein 2|uniref:FMN-binding glutamate synthase family protein n=3 Tax=root TaxID=1 RepID=A0AAJ1VCP4_9BACI|nr:MULTISPECIES: FMN-binding glutamate synthase family protein [Peribacillus]MCD1163026.1 FMN-binding glutamate synthase family protein [Peribacillus castrilensis]MDP9740704.1 glutamate synthase domain-containing protein 2 [Bacillus sp. B2I3]MCZ0871208.1 FMN-binding glutamate synthase family protein [Peribacillus sp. AS_2]MDG4850641.1 FMN-binding glutamate synthase family protein [Peribacillus frigoritolerans]MDM5284785.1 FMN-binding glutamate synthase family protein [Peribacillus frigoritoler